MATDIKASEVQRLALVPWRCLSFREKKALAVQALHQRGDLRSRAIATHIINNHPEFLTFRIVEGA